MESISHRSRSFSFRGACNPLDNQLHVGRRVSPRPGLGRDSGGDDGSWLSNNDKDPSGICLLGRRGEMEEALSSCVSVTLLPSQGSIPARTRTWRFGDLLVDNEVRQ